MGVVDLAPQRLPLSMRPSAWNPDGPRLPIEFVRQSNNGCLTLVIDPKSKVTPRTLDSLQVANLPDAIEALRKRERAPTIVQSEGGRIVLTLMSFQRLLDSGGRSEDLRGSFGRLLDRSLIESAPTPTFGNRGR